METKYQGKSLSLFKKSLKGIAAGVCAVGLCALARKVKSRVGTLDIAQSLEGIPFPGTDLYSFLATRELKPMYTEMAGEILKEKEFHKLLDISTGLGYMPIELALHCKDCLVIGMDESADMVRIAEDNARASHVRNTVDFVTGSVTNLPFPGRYFDLVTSINVLHHWEDPVSVMEEIYHVLLPGGEFWIYDYRYETPQKVWDDAKERLPLYLRLPFTIGPVGGWKAAYAERELRRMIEGTRFEVLSIEPKTFTIFEQKLPAFTLARLRKPSTTTD